MGCSSSKHVDDAQARLPRSATQASKKRFTLPDEIQYVSAGRTVYSPLDRSSREVRLLRIIDPEDERHQHSGLVECDLFHARLPQTDPESVRGYFATEERVRQVVKQLKESNLDFSDLFKLAAEEGNFQTSELRPLLNILPSLFPGLELPDAFKTDYNADKRKPTTHFFTALSYYWGTSPERHEIRVNGCPFMVGTNLLDALKHFQADGEFGSLWIDAICINQEDLNEKSYQLGYMRDIYSLAIRTVIWLGIEGDESGQAMDFIGRFQDVILDEILQQHLSAGGTTQDVDLRYDPRTMDIARILQKLDQQYQDPTKLWKAVFALLNRPWFSRIWTMQEVVLARLTKVQVGGRELPWDRVTQFVSMLYHRKDVNILLAQRGVRNLNSICPRIVALGTLRGVVEMKLDLELSALVAVARGKSATNPRDYVYGMLGLATDNIVVPNYSLSVEDTFIETTKAIIRASKSLDIICFMNRMSRATERLPDLPSWTYNFGQGSPPNALLDTRMQGSALAKKMKKSAAEVEAEMHNACGPRPAAVTYSTDSRTLTTSGAIFDTIVSTGYVLHGLPQNGFDDVDWPFDRTLKNATATTNNPYGTDAAMSEAIWRTLILNKIPRDPNDHTSAAVDKIWPLIAKPCTETEYEPLFRLHLWYKHNRFLKIAGRTLEAWCEMAPTYTQMTSRGALGVADITEEEVRVLADMSNSLRCRRLAVTKKGYIAMVPYDTQQNDVVTVLDGLSVPAVLRVVDEASVDNGATGSKWFEGLKFRVIGGAYVHGIMDGEALPEKGENAYPRFNITLI